MNSTTSRVKKTESMFFCEREREKERREHIPDRVHITLDPWDQWVVVVSGLEV